MKAKVLFTLIVCVLAGFLTSCKDDDEFDILQQLYFLGIVFHRVADVPWGVSLVIGQQRMKRQLEEAVQRGASCVDGGYPGRSEDDVFLVDVFGDIAQERRFTRPCLSCEKERVTGKADNLERVLQLRIIQVDYVFFIFDDYKLSKLTASSRGFFLSSGVLEEPFSSLDFLLPSTGVMMGLPFSSRRISSLCETLSRAVVSTRACG